MINTPGWRHNQADKAATPRASPINPVSRAHSGTTARSATGTDPAP
ncbi:MAG: hypothetical protein QOK26_468 [Pseudonocardiales bacterium]|nr:hypothetical protein [Pseudonocardiales bacterium]